MIVKSKSWRTVQQPDDNMEAPMTLTPMKTYAMSARVLGMPVMCGTFDAINATEARKGWEQKFWSDVDGLRAAIPTMDEMNRQHAEKMIVLMEASRADARQYGLVVTARLSKAVQP